MQGFRTSFARTYIEDVKNTLDDMVARGFPEKMAEFADILCTARDRGKRIYIMGNGGSGSTASHMASDLNKGAMVEGKPRFRAISLADNIPVMLAWANDSAYEDIFVEQLKNHLEEGDVVVGISGSGNSMNVIKAMEYANSRGAVTVGMSGYDGGKLAGLVHLSIHVPNFYMQQVEDIHLLIEHLVTSMIREEARAENEEKEREEGNGGP
ncbi:MAG: SIS domain-containing protein [Thermoplasmata archaeon]|nr:SIS domain-containing protein [Thermoplasmata archaeon]